MPVLKVVKEKRLLSPQDALDKIEETQKLFEKYQGEVPGLFFSAVSGDLKLLKDGMENCMNNTGDPISPMRIVRTCDELRRKFTKERYAQVWKMVYDMDHEWRRKLFAEVYVKNPLTGDVAKWLANKVIDEDVIVNGRIVNKKTTNSEIADLIITGKSIALQLRTPWGRCDGEGCYETLVPILGRNGVWKVHPKCRACYVKSNPPLKLESATAATA